MLHYKLFLSLASVFFASAPSINVALVNHSKMMAQSLTEVNVIDSELKELGIDLSVQNEDSKKIIVAYKVFNEQEKEQSFLVFYIHDKDLEQTIKNVNITIKKSVAKETYNLAPSITNRYEALYFGSTNDKRVHKYAVQIDYDLSTYKYIEFNIGRMTLSDGESTSYPFTVLYNGDNYQYQIKDVIELKNTKAGSIFLEENAGANKFFAGSKGKHNVLYGFDVEDYAISQLQEIEFIYDLYKMEAIAYSEPNSNTSTIAQSATADLFTSKGFFDKDYLESDAFKKRGITYTKRELEFIEDYFINHYELIKSGVSKTITPQELVTNRNGWFERHSYKWNSIMKMSELEEYTNSSMAGLVNKLFPKNEFVVTIDSFDVQKSYLSKIPNSSRANLHPSKNGDMIHHFFDDNPYRDPRCLWLNDVYGIPIKGMFNITPGTHKCIYYNTIEPTNIEVVRMKFLDEQDNPYDLSVITKPIDVTERIGDDEAEKKPDLFGDLIKKIIEILKKVYNWFIKNPWCFYLIIGFFALCILMPFISMFFGAFKDMKRVFKS